MARLFGRTCRMRAGPDELPLADGAAPQPRRFGVVVCAAVCYGLLPLFLAAISVAQTGFRFPVSNNVFHIPYVLRFDTQPEFAQDAFCATLSRFTSIVWPLLRLVADEANVERLFMGAHFVGRAAAFAAMLYLAAGLGVRSLHARLGLGLALGFSPWLLGSSVVGEHGMFINYLTHSELTWPLIFLALGWAVRSRFMLAAAAAGLTFAVNAFVGIWLVLATGVAATLSRPRLGAMRVFRAAAAFAVFSAPVAIWIAVSVSGADAQVDFSYIGYIRQYYPDHFLIEATTPTALANFALLTSCGFLAARLVPESGFWTRLQLGLVALFLIGLPLPYLFDSRFVFNLHLLRSAGLEQAMAVVLCAIAGCRLAFAASAPQSRRLLGIAILITLCSTGRSRSGLVFVAAALLAAILYDSDLARHWHRVAAGLQRYTKWLQALLAMLFVGALFKHTSLQPEDVAPAAWLSAALALALAGVLASRWTGHALVPAVLCVSIALAAGPAFLPRLLVPADLQERVAAASALDRDWATVTGWIRNSDLHGPFIVPLDEYLYEDFTLRTRRPVWVDWKQGAAVMWQPSFYRQWAPRYASVKALSDASGLVAYAREQRVFNLLIRSNAPGCPESSHLRTATLYFSVCELDP